MATVDKKDKTIPEVPHLEKVTGVEKIPVSAAGGVPRYVEIKQIVEKANTENTPDWDASEGEKGFIKNRPFYSEVEPIFDTSWERADYDSYFQGAYQVHLTLDKDITFEVGKTYDVYFDDKKFTGKCRLYEDTLDTEEGEKRDYYSISDQPDDAEIKDRQYPLINGATFSLHIHGGLSLSGNEIAVYYKRQVLNSPQGSLRVLENEVLKKIDEKYLPDSVTNALVQVEENTYKLKGVEDNLQEKLDKIPTLQDGVKGAENNYIYSDPTKAGKGAIAAARYRANDKGKLTAQYKYWGDSDFNYNTEFPQATPTTDGVMSAEDKKALDKINNDFDTLEFTVGTLNEGLGHANNDITKLGERITTLDDELANAVIGEEVIDEDVFPEIDKYTKEELAEELASVSPTIQDIKHNYARKDGAYEGMLVGTALNLQGQDESVNSSMYRTAGGTADIASGLAEIVGIRGESVAWNQWNGAAVKGKELIKDNTEGTTSSYLLVASYGKGAPEGHKFYENIIFSKLKAGRTASTPRLSLYQNVAGLAIGSSGSPSNIKFENNKLNYSTITAPTKSSYNTNNNNVSLTVVIDPGCSIDAVVESMVAIDLTLIYGAGNEPSTPEQFEADYQRWFGKPLTYEEYDEGSIRNVKAEGIKTVGFNLCNNGKAEVFAGHQYQITGTYTSIGINGETITPNGDGKFTPNTQGTLEIVGSDNTTCVHLVWSGKRDGEYELHWEETKSLPITSLKGKLNGEGQEVVIFPDGMKKAGNIYDEIKVEGGVVKAIRRVGSVDLGEFRWADSGGAYDPSSSTNSYTTVSQALDDIGIKSSNNWNIIGLLCSKYPINIPYRTANNPVLYGLGYTNTKRFYISDPSLDGKTGAEIKEILKGVFLYYELATPEEYIIDNFELPLVYKVDDFGTEQVISPENTIAPSLIVKYGMNAVDTLRRLPQNYISVESMDNFLSRLSAAMNGTWTKVWNESTGRYDFSFVANIQNDVE